MAIGNAELAEGVRLTPCGTWNPFLSKFKLFPIFASLTGAGVMNTLHGRR
jgi:hypothetical protein